ncbi:hypothetical protein Sxan_49920 [Streptomyces xanthophaeus]|uniref:Uncharacterized protein n=1 Tax=Streptomyces xanthophaeus TaxID=67385 RepID=A0A919GZ61_9ACTN|nr:hypothetical protein Sxan_49920 [Streptomyces xanthophaeus]
MDIRGDTCCAGAAATVSAAARPSAAVGTSRFRARRRPGAASSASFVPFVSFAAFDERIIRCPLLVE